MRAALIAATLLLLATAAPAAAQKLQPCKGQKRFVCGTLTTPLDHAHPDAAKVHLRYAVQRGTRPLLIALSGGPGQPSVAYAESFREVLAPTLDRYRLAVLDQRGTGKSGVLNCPTLQNLGSLDEISPAQVATCAERIGPRRAFYATADTVEDIEALRVALGAPSVALMGISYGTFVAQQYARTYPATTSALILDSVVPAEGVEPFLIDSYAATPRVLREQCANRRCRGITTDPVGDVAKIAAKLPAGTVRGRTYDTRGRARTTRYTRADELVNLIVSADLNPFMQAMLPGAFAAAVRGDLQPLLRLRAIGNGGPTKLGELSWGLNVATGCADTPLPYALTLPFDLRDAATTAALAAIPAESYAPFDAATVLATSYSQDCSRWPQDVVNVPSHDPLPDVPALILAGRLDMRTPMEGAVELAQELPQAALVRVPGTGHDLVDQDISGCVARALSRFARRRAVGTPCRGKSNAVTVLPRAPRTLASFRRAPGIAGTRGRVLFAVLDTMVDARVTMFANYFSGLPMRGGGLRGGSFSAGDNDLRLRRYAYAPGVRLTGRLRLSDSATPYGRVRVDGPRGASGALRLYADGSVSGRLGGRAVSYGRRGRAARAARAGAAPTLAAVARSLRLTRRARVAARVDHRDARHP